MVDHRVKKGVQIEFSVSPQSRLVVLPCLIMSYLISEPLRHRTVVIFRQTRSFVYRALPEFQAEKEAQEGTIFHHFIASLTAPQDALSTAGFPWLKHCRVQCFVGKRFVSRLYQNNAT